MWGIDGDWIKWIGTTGGAAVAWLIGRRDKHSALTQAKEKAEEALAEAEKLTASQALTIATKDREIDGLREENRMLRLALSLSGREVHG